MKPSLESRSKPVKRASWLLPRALVSTRMGTLMGTLMGALMGALLTACGGSGGVDSGGTGIQPQTLAVGPITGFGSIVVNGVHYDETQARLLDADGQALPASALLLGTTARIDASAVTAGATRSDAVAYEVHLSEELIGPVSSVQTSGSSLVVLGQTVVVNAGTVFDASLPAGLASVSSGAVLAVHGQLDLAGRRIVATRVEPRSTPTSFVVRGVVASVDLVAGRLNIGSLAVALAGVSNLPTGLATGSVVRVKLRTTAVAGVWSATELRLDALALPDRDNVELEGRVSAFISPQRFSINGVEVDASAATLSGTLALGVRAEAKGRSSNGVLLARRVEVDADDGGGSQAFEIEGRITAVDLVARTFVVRGVTISWVDATRFESSTAADIQLNRSVSVKGRLTADGSRVEATQVHVER